MTSIIMIIQHILQVQQMLNCLKLIINYVSILIRFMIRMVLSLINQVIQNMIKIVWLYYYYTMKNTPNHIIYIYIYMAQEKFGSSAVFAALSQWLASSSTRLSTCTAPLSSQDSAISWTALRLHIALAAPVFGGRLFVTRHGAL